MRLHSLIKVLAHVHISVYDTEGTYETVYTWVKDNEKWEIGDKGQNAWNCHKREYVANWFSFLNSDIGFSTFGGR